MLLPVVPSGTDTFMSPVLIITAVMKQICEIKHPKHEIVARSFLT